MLPPWPSLRRRWAVCSPPVIPAVVSAWRSMLSALAHMLTTTVPSGPGRLLATSRMSRSCAAVACTAPLNAAMVLAWAAAGISVELLARSPLLGLASAASGLFVERCSAASADEATVFLVCGGACFVAWWLFLLVPPQRPAVEEVCLWSWLCGASCLRGWACCGLLVLRLPLGPAAAGCWSWRGLPSAVAVWCGFGTSLMGCLLRPGVPHLLGLPGLAEFPTAPPQGGGSLVVGHVSGRRVDRSSLPLLLRRLLWGLCSAGSPLLGLLVRLSPCWGSRGDLLWHSRISCNLFSGASSPPSCHGSVSSCHAGAYWALPCRSRKPPCCCSGIGCCGAAGWKLRGCPASPCAGGGCWYVCRLLGMLPLPPSGVRDLCSVASVHGVRSAPSPMSAAARVRCRPARWDLGVPFSCLARRYFG